VAHEPGCDAVFTLFSGSRRHPIPLNSRRLADPRTHSAEQVVSAKHGCTKHRGVSDDGAGREAPDADFKSKTRFIPKARRNRKCG